MQVEKNPTAMTYFYCAFTQMYCADYKEVSTAHVKDNRNTKTKLDVNMTRTLVGYITWI